MSNHAGAMICDYSEIVDDPLWEIVEDQLRGGLYSYSDLERMSGVSASTLNRIVLDKYDDGRSLHPRTKRKLLAWLGERVMPLLGDVDRSERVSEDRPPGAIPLANKIGAAYGAEQTDKGSLEHWADDWIERGIPADARAYIVDGDSMLPEFRAGDICVCAPSLPAVSGDACLVQLHDDKNCLRYVQIEDGNVILRPGNPRYPVRTYKRERVAYIWPVVEVRRKIRW